MTTLLGFDRSHFNAEPDYLAFKAGGGIYVFCKATEGTGYTDPTFAPCRTHTEAAGLVFGSYHFARWGDPVAEARYYLSVATPQPGELVALDAEAAIPAGVDVVAWALTFCQTVHAAVGAWPLLYENQSWLAGHDWTPLAANDGLWLARYDGQPTGGPTGPFPCLAMKQYTDAGTVPGEPGTVDVDAFQGDLPTLLRYAVPGGQDMPLTQTDVDAVWRSEKVSRQDGSTGGQLEQISALQELADAKTFAEQAAQAAQQAAARPPVTIDQAAADLIAASLVANPTFQQVVASAAAAVVAQMDADLAKRFGPGA